MRKNNHNNRRKTRTGSKGSALAEPPVCTAGQRETVREGLRILARVIAGAHLRREASQATQEPRCRRRVGKMAVSPCLFPAADPYVRTNELYRSASVSAHRFASSSIPQNCQKCYAFRGITSEQFLLDNGMLNRRPKGKSMQIKTPATPEPTENTAAENPDLNEAIRDYVRTYARRHGRRKTTENFGVSRHTLWRFLDRGHMGRALPKAVMNRVGESVEEVDAATWAVEAAERIIANFNRSARNKRPAGPALRQGQEDALLQLCAAPLTTVSELARFNREPPTTLRGRLERMTELGLVDSVSHRLGALGMSPGLDHDHRLGARRGPCRRHELAGMGHRFDVEQDAAGLPLRGQVVEHVAEVHVRHVAQGHEV